MQPILNTRRIARFGALFAVMTLVTACSSAMEDRHEHTKSASQAFTCGTACDDSGVIRISTSVSAYPSTGISSWPSTSTSTSTSTGGGGGGGGSTMYCAELPPDHYLGHGDAIGQTDATATATACADALKQASAQCTSLLCKAVVSHSASDDGVSCGPSDTSPGFRDCKCGTQIYCYYQSRL